MEKFKGWQVLMASFVNAMLIAGATVYSFSLFVTPVEAEFSLTREQSNFTFFGMLYLSMAFWAVTVGRIFEKFSTRHLSIAGAIATAAGFTLISVATSPMMISVAIFTLLGFGLTATGPFLANAMATRWFTVRRGRALGITAVATSAGGFFVVPIFASMITQMGWRQAAFVMGFAIAGLTIAVTYRFLINRPEDIGQYPDGIAQKADIPAQQSVPQQKFLTKPAFWLIAIGTGLLLGSDQALLASLIPYGQDLGFGTEQSAYLLTTITGSAIAGKLVVGWLAERHDKRMLFAGVCTANILFLLAVLLAPVYWQLIMISAVVGLAIGGVYPVWTTLTAEHFGQDQFAKVIGAMNLITVPMIIISIQVAGRTHDQTGDYNLAFKIFIFQVIAAALVIAYISPKIKTCPRICPKETG